MDFQPTIWEKSLLQHWQRWLAIYFSLILFLCRSSSFIHANVLSHLTIMNLWSMFIKVFFLTKFCITYVQCIFVMNMKGCTCCSQFNPFMFITKISIIFNFFLLLSSQLVDSHLRLHEAIALWAHVQFPLFSLRPNHPRSWVLASIWAEIVFENRYYYQSAQVVLMLTTSGQGYAPLNHLWC